LIQIKTALKQLSNKITDDDLRPLLQKWTHTRTLKRFEHLSNYGEIESMLYFIIKGSFRTYITHKDKEEVEVFGFPNNFCCSYVSFLTQQPALHQLQALSKSEVIGIKRADFYTAIHNNWNLENFCRRQTEQLIINRVERALLLRSSSIEKVKLLLESNPNIFQLVPHKYIASYLNMSPATLSRMINKLRSV